jgi:subtilisin family serine protease
VKRAQGGRLLAGLAAPALLAACATAGGSPQPAAPAPVAAAPVPAAPAPVTPDAAPKPREPVAAPQLAYRLGLMPLAATGADAWRVAHPVYDGRGVLIAILDSGVDPGVPGLLQTTTGDAKILDLRNFSAEGDVQLERVHPGPDDRLALPGGLTLSGLRAVRGAAADSVWYGGVVRELPFGDAPAADFNGNGSNRDSFGIVVVRGPSGWLAFIDTNGDGSLADESPLADYLVRRQTFTFRRPGGAPGSGPITGAVNLGVDGAGRPRLSLVLDTAGHGTHVAGIAAGHDLYGVPGFDGVAPGAQIIGLKIADDARGGLSTTGSMITAMEYAARFAAERHLPLVMNMSFGVGNEQPGTAAMDTLVDAFLLAHPDVVFTISAGNDGPGTETMGLPASAAFALTVGSLYPAAFAPFQFGAPSPDVLGWWSSRGGELRKPDIVTPGMAYSAVPSWNTGEEIKLGTSMSAPHAAGIAALLLSAMKAEGRQVGAAELGRAMRATARPLSGEGPEDQGYGVPQVGAAYGWLHAGHAAFRFRVQVWPAARSTSGVVPGLRPGPAAPVRPLDRPTAAYRRAGLLGSDDTIQLFTVRRVEQLQGPPGPGHAYRLVANEPWLRPAAPTVTLGADGAADIEVRYDPARLARPGRYDGAVYGLDVADPAAGPAFRLANVIIVPDSGQWRSLSEPADTLAPSRARRYYVNVPVGAADLSVRVAVPDTGERAFLYLFEPTGRPSRTQDRADIGGTSGKVGILSVSSNDIRPGVWEAVVQAVPGRSLHYGFSASVPPVAVTRVDSAADSPGLSLLSLSARDTTLQVSAQQLGVETEWTAVVEHGAPYRRAFDVPAWATQVVVEVQLTPEFWDTITDFGIVVYDSSGAQLGQGAMNYAFHRVTADLPPHRDTGYRATVELFPAFARPVPPPRFTADVRVAFVGAPRVIELEGAHSPATLALPAHGTAEIRIPRFPSLAPSSQWSDLVRLSAVGEDGDWIAIRRQIPVRRP